MRARGSTIFLGALGVFVLTPGCTSTRLAIVHPSPPAPASRPDLATSLDQLARAGASVHVDRDDGDPKVDVDFPEATSDDALARIRGITNLRALRILKGGITDRGLLEIGPQPDLEVLVVVSNDVTDAGLAVIAGFGALTKLDVMSSRISGAGLEHLVRLPRLRELYLYGSKITDADILPLARLPSAIVVYLPAMVSPAAEERLQSALPRADVKRLVE